MPVIPVSPMLAPPAGAGVLAMADWRAIFGLRAVAGQHAFLGRVLPTTMGLALGERGRSGRPRRVSWEARCGCSPAVR